jgi:eukaryotic-like serine/threonine-protein kinase
VHERFGSYEIYEELGAGGIAKVHLARSRAVANPVALKRLLPEVQNVRELVASFVEEARVARYLQHPGIARVYEFGRIKGQYFIAFEFVPGPTLHQLQLQCASAIGRVPIPVVLAIVDQLCDALDHAHTRRNELGLDLGIVHRDVSPQNVIISKSGQVKLIDFGLAKTKQSTVQSQAGILKGKLNYIAPEYIAGGKVDRRCDLWALGVLMHELLTGERLFDSPDQLVTLDRVRSLPIPAPSSRNPEVPREVDQIVLTALVRDPGRRWQTAADLRMAIGKLGISTLTNQQLVNWVEWAFTQKQKVREDSSISALHEIIKSEQIEVIGELPAISEAILQRKRESVAQMPIGAAMIERRRSSGWIWILLLLLAAAAAGVFFAARRGML